LRVLADGRVERSDGRGTPPDPLAAIEAFVAEGPSVAPFPLGGAIGYLGYELGRFIEPPRGPTPQPDGLPLAWLAHYDPVLVFDRTRGQYALASSEPASARAPWLARLTAPAPVWDGALARAPLAPAWPRPAYLAAARRILAYLAAGDAYQVNLTQPWAAPLS